MTYGELIGNELDIGKVHAEYVGHDYNGMVGVAVFGVCKVCAD